MNIFLAHLSESYKDDQIVLVCDGAAWHKSNGLSIPDNIEVFQTLQKVIDRLCQSIRALSCDAIKYITARDWIVSTFN